MRILAFSDWRIQPFVMLYDVIRLHEPDVILYAGDDLDRFVSGIDHLLLKTSRYIIKLAYPELHAVTREHGKLLSLRAKRIFSMLQIRISSFQEKIRAPFYFVNGNDDFIMNVDDQYYTRINDGQFEVGNRIYQIIEDAKGKITLQEASFLYDGIYKEIMNNLSGMRIDSGIYAPIGPSFGEFEISKGGDRIKVTGIECQFGLNGEIINPPRKYSDIYLSHLPPLGTLDLSVRFGIDHIGSRKLLNAVRKYVPRLVICGHSHFWGGSISSLGETIVVNVSSPDDDPSLGNYALIDTASWSVEMKKVQQRRVHTIPGMRRLIRKCIDTEELEKWRGLKDGDEAELLSWLGQIEKQGIDVTTVKERIKSLKWAKPKIKRPITFNPYDQAFVDVETGLAKGPTPGELWLVGIWHNGDLRQFVFPKEKKDFLRHIKERRITSLVSWTQYDAKALRPLFVKARVPIVFIDACQRTRNCVTWYTYRLHELYSALSGINLSDNLIKGHIAGLYADHLIIPATICPYCPSPQDIVEQIKERNKADILLMIDICRRLWAG